MGGIVYLSNLTAQRYKRVFISVGSGKRIFETRARGQKLEYQRMGII